jgi:hypothetical protein
VPLQEQEKPIERRPMQPKNTIKIQNPKQKIHISFPNTNNQQKNKQTRPDIPSTAFSQKSKRPKPKPKNQQTANPKTKTTVAMQLGAWGDMQIMQKIRKERIIHLCHPSDPMKKGLLPS